SRVQLHQFVSGERLQHPGEPPLGVHVILEGRTTMVVDVKDGAQLYVTDLVRGHIIGLTSLTRQGINASVVAQSLVSCLFVPVEVLDELVLESPELARDFGIEIDNRRSLVLKAFADAGLPTPEGSRVIAYWAARPGPCARWVSRILYRAHPEPSSTGRSRSVTCPRSLLD